jgi:uncharacterized protein YkwD
MTVRSKRVAHYRFARRIVNQFGLLTVLLVVVTGAPLEAQTRDATLAAPSVEQAVHDAVNEARRAEGLPPLNADEDLARIARDHSCAMARQGFFDHQSPGGETMGDRIRKAGKRYASVAENIARIESRDPAARAVAGWLKSPGHRKNMMAPAFTHTGVGACRAGRTVYFTQLFLRPR